MFATMTAVLVLSACQVNEMEVTLAATAKLELLRLKYQNDTPAPAASAPTMKSRGTVFSATDSAPKPSVCPCADCKCTPGNCQCGNSKCPAFDKKTTTDPPPAKAVTKLTNEMSHAELIEHVKNGGHGILIVGNAVPPAIIYGPWSKIPSHKDCNDGVYDCFLAADGPKQQPRTAVTQYAAPSFTTSAPVNGSRQCNGKSCTFVPNR